MALAHQLADSARPIAARYFRTGVTVDDKTDQSPVTIADREAETAMRDLLTRHVPEHGVFGEEHGAVRTDADYVWVLDPIDGTKAFITGLPLFGTLIGLFHRGKPVLGIIDQPILQERWLGVEGERSTLNGRPISVRACAGLASAYMYSTAPGMFADGYARPHQALTEKVKLFRWGGDCYAYGLLAAGHVDLVVEADGPKIGQRIVRHTSVGLSFFRRQRYVFPTAIPPVRTRVPHGRAPASHRNPSRQKTSGYPPVQRTPAPESETADSKNKRAGAALSSRRRTVPAKRARPTAAPTGRTAVPAPDKLLTSAKTVRPEARKRKGPSVCRRTALFVSGETGINSGSGHIRRWHGPPCVRPPSRE